MSTALDTIVAYKRDEVATLKRLHSIEDLLARAKHQDTPRGFAANLSAVGAYQRGGAACLSVLTDGPSFGGSPEDFQAIRSAVDIPMLRKDFMIDTFQVAEARAMGADAILVILSCTDDILAKDLVEAATDLGMDSLIETHDAAEIERGLALPSSLIGINNRDLKIMKTDLATSEQLASMIPENRDFISESGISEAGDISRLRKTGARRFLIGESLMKRDDREAHVDALRKAK